MSEFSERETAFLLELEALSRKYRLQVYGCGCCGSPSLEDLGKDRENELDERAGYGATKACDFAWIVPDDYDWKYGRRPVKPSE